MMIDAATRESLELTALGRRQRAGSLLAAVDRAVTGAGARLLGADLGAPLLDRPRDRGAARSGRLAVRAMRFGASALRTALKRLARHRPRARPAGRRARAARATSASSATGSTRRGAASDGSSAEPRPAAAARPPAAEPWRPWRAGRPALARAGAVAADRRAQGGYIAEGYDAALDALRAAGGEGRRAIAALEARYRDADRRSRAQDPPQRRARLPYRGAGAQRRPADGAPKRLHPPPDAGRRGPLQRARPARARRSGWPRPAPTRSPPRPRISRS